MANAYAKSKGVSLVAAPAGTRTAEEIEPAENPDAEPQPEKESDNE